MIRVELPVLVFIYLIRFPCGHLFALDSLRMASQAVARKRPCVTGFDAPFVPLFSKTKPTTCSHDALDAAV